MLPLPKEWVPKNFTGKNRQTNKKNLLAYMVENCNFFSVFLKISAYKLNFIQLPFDHF